MTKKLVMWTILSVVLVASVVSIVPLVLAHDDWHTKAVTIHAQGERDLIVTKIEESNGHVDWLFEWTVHCDNMSDMASINMTMKVREEKKTSKLEIQKFVFHGDELSFGDGKERGIITLPGTTTKFMALGSAHTTPLATIETQG